MTATPQCLVYTALGNQIEAVPFVSLNSQAVYSVASLTFGSTVAVDPNGGVAGDVYTADKNANIVYYFKSSDGQHLSIGWGWNAPTAVAISQQGDIYVGESPRGKGRVWKLPGGVTSITTPPYVSDKIQVGTNTTWTSPSSIAIDVNNTVYVADYRSVMQITSGGLGTMSIFGSGYVIPVTVAVSRPTGDVFVLDLGIKGEGQLLQFPLGDPNVVNVIDGTLKSPYAMYCSYVTGNVYVIQANDEKLREYPANSLTTVSDSGDAFAKGAWAIALSC